MDGPGGPISFSGTEDRRRNRKGFLRNCDVIVEQTTLMLFRFRLRRRLAACLAIAVAFLAARAEATVVRFETSVGNITVRLFDAATPLSVANFLNYSTSNRYDATFIHRVPQSAGASSHFVIQGGGFKLNNSIFQAAGITTDAPVLNEPGISNLRGTLSYAKGSDPNSATSQWFFNVGNNTFLDQPGNGAFTAFGRVVGNGMTVVDAIDNLEVINAGVAQNAPGEDFDEIPVLDLDKVLAQQDVTNADAVMINDVKTLNVPAGDYNFDGKVDGADLTVWKTDFGSTLKAEADGNGDGVVNGADLLVWQRTFGQNFGVPAAAAIAAVPEPAAATLALLAAACGFARRSRP
jgi:peptidyl-prolyl cis-trans isomerase A (cyclophilin A)